MVWIVLHDRRGQIMWTRHTTELTMSDKDLLCLYLRIEISLS